MYRKLKWATVGVFALSAWASGRAAPGVDVQTFTSTMQGVRSDALLGEVAQGAPIRLENVLLDGEILPVTLEMERFEVFTPDARILVHGPDDRAQTVKPPASAYFQGGIHGDPDSIAVLSADPSGVLRGIVQQADRFWVLGGGAAVDGPAVGLVSRELKRSGASDGVKPFRCDVGQLPKTQQIPKPLIESALKPQALVSGQYYAVPVAIETDGEFFKLFGSTAAATSYIGNLFAYGATIYQREVQAKLEVSYVSLWSGGPTTDPWTHTSTSQGLSNFGDYWRANRAEVKRAVAHFLSGRNLGGGIAWTGVLCDNDHGYGYSSGINGQFQISNPGPVWDIIVVSHEIGHNFDSPHTHDYQNIGGISSAIDACYNSATGKMGHLPGLASRTGGVAGAGNGTIMSYCHLIAPGYSNITMTFGQNHPYGIRADRVSDLMSAYVAQVADAAPSCITVSGTAGQPDFVVTGVTLSPPSPTASGTFNAVLSVRNRGTVAGNGGSVGLWSNQPGAALPCKAAADVYAELGPLAPGARANVKVTLIPAGSAGTKTLRAFVDRECATAEPNETNNQFTKAYTVGDVTSKPDFVVTGITLNPESPTENTSFSAVVSIKNQGTLAGTGGSLGLWSNQPGVQSCNAAADASADVGSVAVGSSVDVTVSGLAAGAVGAKTLRAFVDRTCATGESDENNNQFGKAYTVRAVPTGPDLVVTGITLSPANPGAYSGFSATVTVENQGTVDTNGGWLDIWTDQSAIQACGASGNTFRVVGTLPRGTAASFTVSGLIAGPAGTKTLRAFVDSFCQTAEYDEVNNQRTATYTVMP